MKHRVGRAIIIIGVFVGATTGLSRSPVAAAEDFGNWQFGCAPGWTCFWQGDVNVGQASASTTKDSNFTNNIYANLTPVDNRVRTMQNRFNTTSVRAFLNTGYNSPAAGCLPAGFIQGPFPVSPNNGLSSFRAC